MEFTISEDKPEDAENESPVESSWSWTQTMNYVGQLAGQVFVTVKELYRGLNPATLSGCIDIIVVRQPDGSFQCSPFHVRFGKMGVLRSREKVVDIEINGEAVDLHMKLGENGEAFFVQETESGQEDIPSYLATSPILSEGAMLMESQLRRNSAEKMRNLDSMGSLQMPVTIHATQVGTESPTNSGSVKKRRKRRRKSKVDSIKRDEIGSSSGEDDLFPIEMSSDEENEPLDSSRASVHGVYIGESAEQSTSSSAYNYSQPAVYPYSDGDWSPFQSQSVMCKGVSSLPVPVSGGLSVSCPQQSAHFPSSDSPPGSRPSTPKSDSELVSKPSDRGVQQTNPQMHWPWGELPQAAKPISLQKPKEPSIVNIPPSENTHFRVIESSHSSGSLPSLSPLVQSEPVEIEEPRPQSAPGCCSVSDGHVLGSLAPSLPENGEASQIPANVRTTGKMDSPSKKKDKRCRHLGTDGVYLDDLTEMDPEVAALYFPKSGEAGIPVKNWMENGTHSPNQSPQSVGSSGMDSGVESVSDMIGDMPSIAISLCGGLNDNKEIKKETFLEHVMTYQQFAENPAVIDDPNLVVKIGNTYYNWTTAAPMLLAMQAFQKPLPKATVENIMRDKMPKKGGRWWFSWRGRNNNVKVEATAGQDLDGTRPSEEQSSQLISGNRIKDESSSSDEDPRVTKLNISSVQQDPSHLSLSAGVSFKKTLRLTSEQLKQLQLKDGPNDVVFSVTTQYQGTCRCEGTIYLWNWDDKIVISDIDGTITRSDTLGHILPTLGKDWTHQGIAKLYHKVSQNGYKFLYCSARAIGMAGMTRGYLHWVNERGTMLPQGPVLLSPSSLFSALHREVIEKKPEKFKIECLTDIKNLFISNTVPFYAAFGNRPTDVYSYKQVGVPLNRIFTVNPKGELIQEHAKTNISSYVRLCEVVDHVFPLLKRGHSSDFPCSDTYSQFTFWREPVAAVENQDIHTASS
ncbi:phosphatidate phosphatase LPIN1 isoform X2 [Latimeria chalumnae]|uniref:phosphatidate phosphatase LPIN1 isoform X2 n=1 Tax=Latimeria chalumnae TaxID=7897 RepID=UPI00313EA41C